MISKAAGSHLQCCEQSIWFSSTKQSLCSRNWFFSPPWLKLWGAWSFLGKLVPWIYEVISFYSLFFVSGKANEKGWPKSWASLEDFYLVPGGASVSAVALGKCLRLRGCQIHATTWSALVLSLQALLGENTRMHAGKLSKSADEDGELRRVFFSFHPHVHTSSYQWAERSGRRPCNGRAQEQTHIELVCGLSGNKETPSPAGCSAAGVQQGARLCACRGSTGPQLLFKIERKRAWFILAAAFWRCLWLSFWGGGGREIGLGGRWR